MVGKIGVGMGGAIRCALRGMDMLVFGEFGIMLGCTLGGVRGDCNELHGGRDATCLGGAGGDGSSNLGYNVAHLSFVGL